jgi:hypothetical protein
MERMFVRSTGPSLGLALLLALAFLPTAAAPVQAEDIPGSDAPLEKVFLQLSGMG